MISTSCGSIPTTPNRQILGVDQGAIVTLNGGKTWSSLAQPADRADLSRQHRQPFSVPRLRRAAGFRRRGAAEPHRRRRRHHDARVPRSHRRRRERMIAPDPDDPDIVYGGRVDKLDLRTGQTRIVDPTLPTPGSLPAHVDAAAGVLQARSEAALLRQPEHVPHDRRRRALGCDQSRSHARGSRRAAEPRCGHRGEQRTAGSAPRRDLRDRAVAARRAADLGRHRRWPDLAHARRRRALGQRHAAGADAVVEGRHHRGLALRRGHRVRRDRPASPRRSQAVHLSHARRRQVLAARSSPASATAISSTRCARIRERKGLLYAGTELGMYVSFDDGEHWQPLQANLPRTSVRDIDVHGDDLVIATHGRGFWIMDDVSRRCGRSMRTTPRTTRLFAPATAIRARVAAFTGTPLPKDEPIASNPPSGAMIDYVLAQAREEAGRARDLRCAAAARAPLFERRSGAESRSGEDRRTRRNGFRVRRDSRRRRACIVSSGRCATRNPPRLPTATPTPTACGRRRAATRSSSSSTASDCASR